LSQGSIQVCTMPDGTLLTLVKVTFGKRHQFEVDQAMGVLSLFGKAGRSASANTSEDTITYWFTRRNATTGQALDFDWWSHCIAVDDHGFEMMDEISGRHAFYSNGSASESGSRPFTALAAQSSVTYDEIVVNGALRPFRHAGDTFKLRVFD